jgi:hypothetical protein
MTAPVTDLRAYKATRIALASASRVRALAEDLLAVQGVNGATLDEARYMVATYYVQQGWCSEGEVRMALEQIGENR